MSADHLSRRRFLRSAAIAGFGATIMHPDRARAETRRTLDLEVPADNLTAMVKMRGSLEAVDVPHWYFGTVYGVLPGKAPIPLVDFEGSEIDYYERQPDGSYRAYGATVSFFRDTRTGKLLETFDNPITGKSNHVEPNSIAVKAWYEYSVRGFKRSDDPEPLPNGSSINDQLKWIESGDQVWLNMRRAYPAGVPMGEDQLVRGTLRELHDPDLPSVQTTASPTFIAPWLRWMDMKGHEGHTVWTGPAHKLPSIDEYPAELRALMEKHFPHKLTAKPG